MRDDPFDRLYDEDTAGVAAALAARPRNPLPNQPFDPLAPDAGPLRVLGGPQDLILREKEDADG